MPLYLCLSARRTMLSHLKPYPDGSRIFSTRLVWIHLPSSAMHQEELRAFFTADLWMLSKAVSWQIGPLQVASTKSFTRDICKIIVYPYYIFVWLFLTGPNIYFCFWIWYIHLCFYSSWDPIPNLSSVVEFFTWLVFVNLDNPPLHSVPNNWPMGFEDDVKYKN